MPKSLINAYSCGANQIAHLYTENGKLHKEVVNFKPFLALHAKPCDTTSWSDMYNKPVKVKIFDSITDMHKFKKDNRDSIDIFGDVQPVYQFIASKYQNDIELDREGIKIFNIDIECFSDEFPKPEIAKFPINAITVNEMCSNTYVTFAYGGTYVKKHMNESYIECSGEVELIELFLDFWQRENPQIVTGWYINSFDIPYLVNRIKKVCGDEIVKKLSIDKKISAHNHKNEKTEEVTTTYTLQGHIIWDYIDLYKKYTQETREMYTLDHISAVELGDNKVSYHDEFDNLNELYEKDYQKFIEYNIKDTALVYELDQKLDYINLALSIMQKAKCQPEDIFGTVRPWDCIIYNFLLSLKMMCPPNRNHEKVQFVGGYVAEPVAGLHEDTEVVDIVSSYPNQIRSFNMSPETILSDVNLPPELLAIKNRYSNIDLCADIDQLDCIKETLKKYNVSFTSNGHFFDISKEGILPAIFTKFFQERKKYKKLVKTYKAEGKLRESKIADLYQYTLKILLNSGYGAVSNNYFRYFDIRIGEAITSNGQVCCKGAIKHVEKKFPMIKTIYADTDSNFYCMSELIKMRFKDKVPTPKEKLDFILKFSEQMLEPELNKFFVKLSENMNMRELTIGMEAECVADVTLFVAKKKYIMNKVWDEGDYLLEKPKRKIRGVEIVRSSTPKVIRNKLKEAVELIFTTKSNDAIIEFINIFKKEFMVLPIEEIAFPRSVNFSDYTLQSKGLPIAVKAAFIYNRVIEAKKLKKYPLIADGNKIKFIYIKEPNYVGSYVFGFMNRFPVELKDMFKIDYEMQYQKCFLDPLTSILDAIGWQVEYRNSLFD